MHFPTPAASSTVWLTPCSVHSVKTLSLCAVNGQSEWLCPTACCDSWLVQVVGPILVEDAKPLPQDLQHFLDQGMSHEHHAVYVFLGTLARPSAETLRCMAAALNRLPNPVLWKLDPLELPGRCSCDTGSNTCTKLLLLAKGHETL